MVSLREVTAAGHATKPLLYCIELLSARYQDSSIPYCNINVVIYNQQPIVGNLFTNT